MQISSTEGRVERIRTAHQNLNMEVAATRTIEPKRHRIRSPFSRSDRSIRQRLIVCFVLIVLLIMAADAVAVWQFRQISAASERLSDADQTSHAVVRVHLDVDTFRDSMAALASSHDAEQFSSEAASIRRTFLRDLDQAEQVLRATPDVERDATVSGALESLRMTLLSQVDTAVQLAAAGEWSAIGSRMATQIPALIDYSSSLVERVDQQVLQQRTKAIEDTQQARRRLVIIVPFAALLTLLAAAGLGWYITWTITAPLSELTAGAGALARRDFSNQINVRGHDEMAVLGKAFNYAARELQQLYEGLRRSERELRDVINTVPAHVWSASPDGNVDFINERLREFTGLPQDDILGGNWQSVLHPDDRERFVIAWRAALKNGQSMESEVRMRRTDGQYCWFLICNVPLRDEAGKVLKWYGSGIEIQDRKRAEEERERLHQLEADLAHINRVSMMGELAASLAHEIKQPIGAAVTNAEACLRLLDRDQPDLPEACEAVTEMVSDARRAAAIIDRVRSLYRKGSSQLEMVAVNEVIGEMVVILRNEANRYSVVMHTDLAEGLPTVMADRVQLQQVLMNLMLNGIEAMRDRSGQLSIKSQLAEVGQLLISVTDTGVGLPSENVARIFDAFFTTKSQGTGLGLAITRSIVEAHGGRIWATANSGRGSTFFFTLPTNVALSA
jgi:PAS domain S-box-containing protein